MSNINSAPVHGLLASAELLQGYRASESQPKLSSFESECLGTIEHCANTLVDVIDNVLSFAKIEPDVGRDAEAHDGHNSSLSKALSTSDHSLTSVDLVEFIEQIIDSCWAGKITSGKDLMVIYDADLSVFSNRLFVNRGELSRIILNIFGNAYENCKKAIDSYTNKNSDASIRKVVMCTSNLQETA